MSQTNTSQDDQLVDAHGLLARLFEPETRPSLRWVRTQTKRKSIPFYRIGGRLIRFDVAQVRAALERNCLVVAKNSGRPTTVATGTAR